LYPEFIAQLTGYTRSPRRKPYSHLLIDVGAGTLDVSVFCIENSDDETFYKVVAEEVQNLGVEILNRYRLKVLNKPVSQLDEMQEKTDRDIASILKISEDDLNSVDEPFRNQINSLISGFMRDLRSGAMSIEEVTIILCGGGKYVSLYSQALEPVKRDFKIAPIDLEPIENLRGPDRAITEYHRYSVAAGLCDDPFNISKLQRHQLEQIDNSRRSEEFEQTIQNRRNEMYKG
jgi:cell division ATPase FtsA